GSAQKAARADRRVPGSDAHRAAEEVTNPHPPRARKGRTTRSLTMKTSLTITTLALTIFLIPIGCNRAGTVTRVDPERPTDLNYRFNETDAQQVFHSATADALARPWIDIYQREHNGQRPILA